MIELIEPKETQINGKVYILSKLPYMVAREVFCQYIPSGLPKIGDYRLNEELSKKLLSYVAVYRGEEKLRLLTVDLINNYIPNLETGLKLEWAMTEYNNSFFQDGRVSTFLSGIAQNLPQLISEILTASLQQLSQVGKPRSTN